MQVKLKFPVFSIGKDGDNMIYVDFDENKYHIASMSVLKSDYFNNLEVIDSGGNVYWIKKAEIVKYRGLWGYTSLLTLEKQVIIRYDYQDKTGKIALEDFKKRIIPKIEKMKGIWEESYDDIEELKTYINNAESFEKIAELLG